MIADLVLEHPAMYRALHSATGLRRLHARLLDEVRDRFEDPRSLRVLDLGCGPGDTLKLLRDYGHYTGIDLNGKYIDQASKTRRPGARFITADVTTLEPADVSEHDLIIAFGLIHHLNDSRADRLLSTVASVLSPRGRFITLDGCYRDGMPSLAGWFLRHDRGRFVRAEREYLDLFSRHLRIESTSADPSAMHIPYSILSIVGTRGGG